MTEFYKNPRTNSKSARVKVKPILRATELDDRATLEHVHPDLLNKLAYDTDVNVSMSAIFALGLIGAGTNNSRLAGNLRYIAAYFANSADQLFVVRIA
jgi:hypothetical protein